MKKMNNLCRAGAVATIALKFLVCANAQGQPTSEAGWSDLTDQPSRKELFENVIKASLEADATQKTTPNPIELAIPKDFFFPDDARVDKIQKKDRENVIFGIDVSHHDGKNFDLSALRVQKVDFIYVKATQGVSFRDPAFERYWKTVAELKPEHRPFRGAYHFLTAGDDGREQADRFVRYVNLHGGFKEDDMPPCVDLEWDVTNENPDRWKGQTPEKILEKLVAWLERTRELTGRTPVIYTARSWWIERGIPESKFSVLEQFPIWIADYSRSHKAVERPAIINGRTQSIWQFADDAKLTLGYSGTLDANIFYGSRQDFISQFHLKQ